MYSHIHQTGLWEHQINDWYSFIPQPAIFQVNLASFHQNEREWTLSFYIQVFILSFSFIKVCWNISTTFCVNLSQQKNHGYIKLKSKLSALGIKLITYLEGRSEFWWFFISICQKVWGDALKKYMYIDRKMNVKGKVV